MKNKNIIKYAELFGWYHSLFTTKQQNYLNDYFLNDLSLNEIAKKYHVSSIAIADSIKHSKKMLDDYENQLHLYKKHNLRNNLYKKITNKTVVKKLLEIDKI
ncbi:MAG: DNA-binding protein [Mycoplasmataceae bacterium]|jgi:predicted DNA-binding protein YlxM (UPF0122 family)|nr:DNA-binding protein [Mycoplasmataceae bacterium]